MQLHLVIGRQGRQVAHRAGGNFAQLDRLESPGWCEKIEKRGNALKRGLKKLSRQYPKAIAEVRGSGLMLGVEMHGPAGPVIKGLRERGILAIKAGDRVLRLLPPLVVGSAEVKRLLTALGEVLAEGAVVAA